MLKNITESPFINVLAIIICFDTALGILRAIKQKKLNSTFGSNGCIRKVAMIVSIVCLGVVDETFNLNAFGLIPQDLQKFFPNLGLCGFFAILFIAFESISILKNMQLCGLPVPKKIRQAVEKFLKNFTDELPKNQ
ncbi:protein UtxA [Clostridia bacterium]|nr:protein UtxA [Clostridia bacterium]